MNSVIRHVDRFDRFTFLWLHVTLQIPRYRAVHWISRSGDGLLYVLTDQAQGQLIRLLPP